MMMLMNDPVGRSLLSSHLTPSAASWHLKGRDYHHHHPDQHDHFLHQYKVMFSGGRPPSNGLKWTGIKFPGNHSQQHSAKQHSTVQYPAQCNTLCNGALTCTMHNFAFYCHLSCKKNTVQSTILLRGEADFQCKIKKSLSCCGTISCYLLYFLYFSLFLVILVSFCIFVF